MSMVARSTGMVGMAVLARRAPRALTLLDVRREVLRFYGITLAEFMGPGRHPTVVEARGVFVVLCKRERNLRVSYPEITRAMRGEDVLHTTAITAMRRMERNMPADEGLRRRVAAVQGMVDLVRCDIGAMGPARPGYRLGGRGVRRSTDSVVVNDLGIVYVRQLPPLTSARREVLVRGFGRRWAMYQHELREALGWSERRLAAVLSRMTYCGDGLVEFEYLDDGRAWVRVTRVGRLVVEQLDREANP